VEQCHISDECFAVPSGYRRLHTGGRGMVDQEEELLQMAIQQSLAGQDTQGEGLALANGDTVKNKEDEVGKVCKRWLGKQFGKEWKGE